MGIVVVHPEEDGAARRGAGDPGERRLRDGGGIPLGIALAADILGDGVVVVDLEAAGQAESPVEDPRRDERRRRIAAPRENRSEGRQVRREGGDPVVPNPVPQRVQPRHQRAVRRKRQGRGRQGARVKRVPPRASASRLGVRGRPATMRPTWSARVVSSVIRMREGGATGVAASGAARSNTRTAAPTRLWDIGAKDSKRPGAGVRSPHGGQTREEQRPKKGRGIEPRPGTVKRASYR